MFCLIVHRFLARVQSLTCFTYRKFLQKSTMAVLTPKSGIVEVRLGFLSKVLCITSLVRAYMSTKVMFSSKTTCKITQFTADLWETNVIYEEICARYNQKKKTFTFTCQFLKIVFKNLLVMART